MNKLAAVSTYHLMIELIYDGKAEIVPEVAIFEPFDVNEILAVLRLRANSDFGSDTQAWVSWFLDSKGVATERERETFRLLKKSKDQNDRFISKFSEKFKGPNDNGSGSK